MVDVKRLILLFLLLGPGVLLAQSCRVVDPELLGTYDGACRNGLADGEGVARGSAVYEGEFKAGKKHGRGRKVWPTGDSYEGTFVADAREGEGIYRWGGASPWAGDFYWGYYRQDKRHGRGLYAWGNGDRFEGEWKDDLRYGYSAMEIQRQRTREAWMSSLGRVGATVCSVRPLGLAHQIEVQGDVVALQDDTVAVRLVKVQSRSSALPDDSIQPGVVLKGTLYEWFACPTDGA